MKPTNKFSKTINGKYQDANDIQDEKKPYRSANEQIEDRTIILSKIQFLIEQAYHTVESETNQSKQ